MINLIFLVNTKSLTHTALLPRNEWLPDGDTAL